MAAIESAVLVAAGGGQGGVCVCEYPSRVWREWLAVAFARPYDDPWSLLRPLPPFVARVQFQALLVRCGVPLSWFVGVGVHGLCFAMGGRS